MRGLLCVTVAVLCGCEHDPLPVPDDAGVVLDIDSGMAAGDGGMAARDLAPRPCVDDGSGSWDLPPPPARLPFDAPKILAGTTQACCNWAAVAVGDVTGDGLADVVAPTLLQVLPAIRGGG